MAIFCINLHSCPSCKEVKRWSLPATPLSWQVLQQVKKQFSNTLW